VESVILPFITRDSM